MGRTMIALAATAGLAVPLGGQEVIQLPVEDSYLEADFEEVFRVGATMGEPWEQFTTIVKVAFDEGGTLYVFDGILMAGLPAQLAIPTSLRVLVFDPAGGFQQEFGRIGEGPGEFNWPNSYVVMRDGTTVVGNVRSQAYQIFDPAGNYVRMVRMPEDMQMNTNSPRGSSRRASADRGFRETHARLDLSPVWRLALAGDVAHAETVAEGWLPESPVLDAAMSMGFGPMSMPAIFEPELLYERAAGWHHRVQGEAIRRPINSSSRHPTGGARVERVISPTHQRRSR